MRTFLLLLLAVVTTHAQRQVGGVRAGGSDSGQQLPAEDFCSITGYIGTADSKEPVKKVSVSLVAADRQTDGATQYATTTDANGGFVLSNIEPGRYRLWVSRNGYVRQEYGAKRPGRPGTMLNLTRGQRLSGIDFALVRQSVITGSVLDADGEPLSRVSVQALRFSWIRGRKQLVPVGGDQTDDRGQYRIYELPPGKYLVAAIYRGDQGKSVAKDHSPAEALDESYVATYYPGTTDAATAVPTETRAGADGIGVDIRLQRAPTVRVRGQVISQVGGDPSRYTVTLLRRASLVWLPMDQRTAKVDAKGRFEIQNVTPGSYTLSAESGERDLQSQSARVQVDVGRSSIDGVTVSITSATELKGRVKVEEGTQLPLHKIHVFLTSRDNMIVGASSAGSVNEDGSFSLPYTAGDVLDVSLRGLPPGHYLRSVRYGQEDALANGLNSSQGAQALEVFISAKAAQAEGVVVNDKQQPVSGATVVIAPDGVQSTRSDLYISTTTDQTGNYLIDNLAPGKYRLFAFEDLEQGASQDPDYLKGFEQNAEKVVLQEKQKLSQQLLLIGADYQARR